MMIPAKQATTPASHPHFTFSARIMSNAQAMAP